MTRISPWGIPNPASQANLDTSNRPLVNWHSPYAAETTHYGQIERAQADTRKFSAEMNKLAAEAQKFNRDRWLAPFLAIAAVIGGLLGTASFIAKLVWGL